MDTDKTFRVAHDPAEQLLFTTIRIVANHSDGQTSSGTGFFYEFCKKPDGTVVPGIVTNKHVINGAISLTLTFRKSSNDLHRPIIGESFEVSVTGIDDCYFHPDPEVDLCVVPLTQLFDLMVKDGRIPWIAPIGSDFLFADDEKPPLRAIENILMVGYPIGLWDDVNDMPIVRRGITASHPKLNWRGKKEFLIDAACFPGSSGSPVFLVRDGLRTEVSTGKSMAFTSFRLLGVLYAGPQFGANGEITIVDVPSVAKPLAMTQIPTNLGFVIKASALRDIEAHIESLIAQGKCHQVAAPQFTPQDQMEIPALI